MSSGPENSFRRQIKYVACNSKGQRMFRSLSFFLGKYCFRRHKCEFSEVFAYAKVKLLCSEVRAMARVKLSLPTLPKAKLHYPQKLHLRSKLRLPSG